MDHHDVVDPQLLPPGCRFHPSEEQLLRFFLPKKNSNNENIRRFDVIKELDVFNHNPFNLPVDWSFSYGYKGRKRHWYGYCVRVLSMKTDGGFWKRKGRVRDVIIDGGVVLGTRVSFVFYVRDLVEDAVRTNWHMHEYALVDSGPKAFVLCRVFVKFRHGHASCERALFAGNNVSAVRHIGVQHDETITSDNERLKECDINSVDRGIPTSCGLSEKAEENDDKNDPGVVSAPHSHFGLVGSSMTEHEKSSYGLTIKDYASSDDLTAHELNYILEGDYLELNDLLSPLPGNDDT